MAKRKSGSDDESPHSKRQKLTRQSVAQQEPVNIQSSEDLQLLLAFQQDAGPHVKQSKNPTSPAFLHKVRTKSVKRISVVQVILRLDCLRQ